MMWQLLAGFTILSAFVNLGFSVGAWYKARGEVREASQYTLVRSIALIILAVIAVFLGNNAILLAGITIGLLTFGDSVIGFRKKDVGEAYGTLSFGLISTALVTWCLVSM